MPQGKRRESLKTYLEEVVLLIPILPYDSEAAAWHAEERARLSSAGKTPPFADGQIAAVAYVNGLTLVTFNVRDFSGFARLRIEDWSN